jgi:hypothetical protein
MTTTRESTARMQDRLGFGSGVVGSVLIAAPFPALPPAISEGALTIRAVFQPES